MASSTEEKAKELQLDINELKTLAESAQRTKVKDIMSIAARKLETDLVILRDHLEEKTKSEQTPTTPTTPQSAAKKVTEVALKDYSWDQSEKFVKFYLTNLPGLSSHPNDQITTTFYGQSVTVNITDLNGKSYAFCINQTCHQLNPDKCYHKAKSDYLLVFLAKHNPGSSWSHITAAEKTAADSKKKADEPKADAKEDPSAGLMNMMKKMYSEGDDEMKRTIAKAWTEGQDKKSAGAGLDGLGGMGGF